MRRFVMFSGHRLFRRFSVVVIVSMVVGSVMLSGTSAPVVAQQCGAPIELVTNGTFETPVLTEQEPITFVPFSAASGWSGSFHRRAEGIGANDSDQWGYIPGGSASFHQVLNTAGLAGTEVTIRFQYYDNPFVTIGNTSVQVPGGTRWTSYNFTYVLTASDVPQVTLDFTTYAGSASIDDVSVTYVLPCSPSPPSLCDQAIAGEGDFAHYEVVYAPARGGAGSQLVIGGPGSDTLRGGSGHDLLCGLGGNDDLRGGSGNDILDGGDGTDTLRGQSGNDTLLNGEDNNGGSGNDN